MIDDTISLVRECTNMPVGSEETFLRDIGLDNLDIITIGIEIEMRYGCELSDAELFSWHSVGDIAATIARVSKEECHG